MTLSPRFSDALTLAWELHRNQTRKGSGIPYMTHLMAVSCLVGEYGGDEDLIIGGLLHDSIEDCSDRISLPQLIERFGWRVGKVVEGCSDCQSTPKPPWEQRKRAYVERLKNESTDIKLVAASDKLHNASALLRDTMLQGDAHWSRFKAPKERQCWYLRACFNALADGWSNAILQRLDETVSALERSCC